MSETRDRRASCFERQQRTSYEYSSVQQCTAVYSRKSGIQKALPATGDDTHSVLVLVWYVYTRRMYDVRTYG